MASQQWNWVAFPPPRTQPQAFFRPSPLTAAVGQEKSTWRCFSGGRPLGALDPAVEVEALLSAPGIFLFFFLYFLTSFVVLCCPFRCLSKLAVEFFTVEKKTF